MALCIINITILDHVLLKKLFLRDIYTFEGEGTYPEDMRFFTELDVGTNFTKKSIHIFSTDCKYVYSYNTQLKSCLREFIFAFL